MTRNFGLAFSALSSAVLLCSCASTPSSSTMPQSQVRHPSSENSGAGTCLAYDGSQIDGTLIARCNNVVRGSAEGSLFDVKTGHFCIIKKVQAMNDNQDDIVSYFGMDWQGLYVGTSESNGSLIPTPTNQSFAPGAPASYSTSSEYYSLPDGSPSPIFNPKATVSGKNVEIDAKAQDGTLGHYANFRTVVKYNDSAKTMNVQYFRHSLFSEQKLVDVALSCE